MVLLDCVSEIDIKKKSKQLNGSIEYKISKSVKYKFFHFTLSQ